MDVVVNLNIAQLPRDVIVVGASAGGVEATASLLGALTPEIPATLALVIHRSPHPSALEAVLARRSRLRVREVTDRERTERGCVYVAPPERHLLFEDSALTAADGPREHASRPAIDPLFTSAAYLHGARVVGVLLSGSGHDGTAGLRAIKDAGGVTLVQDPAEAKVPFMPMAAIAGAEPEATLSVAEIARALDEMARGRVYRSGGG